MNLRKLIFNVKDVATGGNVNKYIKITREHDLNNSANFDQLDHIIRQAKSNCKFYSNREYKILSDFPVINKRVIIENYNDFISSEFKNKKLHIMKTSGSTGVPFTVLQNSSKRSKVLSDLIYYNEKFGQSLGEPYLFIRTKTQGISKLRQLMNNEISIESDKLSNEHFEDIVDAISRTKSKSILSYATTYEFLVNYLKEINYLGTNNLVTLFTSATVMSESLKEDLEKILGVQVIDRYSNQENGVIALAEGAKGKFKVNRSSFIVELLNLDNDKHVNKGEIGRIVITDLYNEAIPFIRYDTGDVGISYSDDMSNIDYISTLEGRVSDIIFDVERNSISPHTWTALFRQFEKIKQWQLIQKQSNSYILKLILTDIDDLETIDSRVRSILGSKSEIEIIEVDFIPLLPNGKFKATVYDVLNSDSLT